MERSVLEWLEKRAASDPEKTGYSDGERSLSFRELMEKARSVGTYLLKKDPGPGPVAVMTGRSVDCIPLFLGAVYAGHAYAPVGIDIPEERKEKILKRLNPSCVTGKEDMEEAFMTAEDEELLKSVRDKAAVTDPLYIIFTSGSSGDPKGVITSHLSLMNYIEAYSSVMGIGAEDRMAAQSPLDYIAAIRDIYVPLLTWAYDVLIHKEYFMQPDVLVRCLNENRISCIGWSTSAMTVLSKLSVFKGGKPEFINKVCFSGSVMPGSVLREWQEAMPGALFVNQYGPTETTASCTYYKLDHLAENDETVPIGKPYDNYRIFLLSEEGSPVKDGEEGEIAVSGVGVTDGYINDPDRTAAAFMQNPLNDSYNERIYKTGDIGVIREDGMLMYRGRRDRQIKYMGHRVELDEIESAAASFGVTECAALYDPEKELIWFFYGGNMSVKDLSIGLRKILPGFMVPRKIKNIPDIPRLPNGKTDIRSLRSMIH
ncbi:MAG: amino acid adenylation domain-containing protein [Lachnospiraceae bacterium]|nr:amino acid adenylation domain-containing protein [Lachnospiraceae bacterium]